MKRQIVVLFILMLVMATSALAEATAVFNKRCLQIQEKLYTLQLSSASELLKQEQAQNPENITTHYFWVIHDLLKVLTSESPASFANYYTRANKSLKSISTYQNTDGYGDFFREEIHFYSSVVHGKAGNPVSAANEIRMSYKYGEKLIREHSDFTPAYKTMGIIHAGLGNLPSSYRKMVSVLGYQGTTGQGIEELQKCKLIQNNKPEWLWIQKEAVFYLAAVDLYLKNDPKSSWKLIEELTTDYKNNPLLVFIRANFADKCKKNDEVIKVVNATPKSAMYEPIPYLQFLLGTAKLQRIDKDASVPLLQFIASTKGKSYVKSCYQKLAWHQLVNGNSEGYKSYMKKLLSSGSLNLEEDQQANMEAGQTVLPDARLLKTRLLYDGGYTNQALASLANFKVEDFETTLTKTEYCYRKAQLYQRSGDFILAEAFYKAAILTGADLTVYFASYACIYLAEMYESQGKKELAKLYFQKATSFKNNKQYKNSVEHRAQAGLQRLR